MTRNALAALIPLACCVVAGGGCVLSIGGGTTRTVTYVPHPPHPPKPSCPVDPADYTVVIDEIDAAGRLDFDPSRVEMLKSIAERPGLTDAAQAHLVCTALCRLDFDPSKEKVLLALVHNPEFRPRAKGAILRNLNRLSFEPTRTHLMREMQGRGDEEPDGEPQLVPSTAPSAE